MNEPPRGPHFWIGNLLLGLALLLMMFLSEIWARLGPVAMVLWMVLTGAGIYLITRDKGPPGANMPD